MTKTYKSLTPENIGPVCEEMVDIVSKADKPFKIVLSNDIRHSGELLKRFHAHLTHLWKWAVHNIDELSGYTRDEFKIRILFYACSIPDDSLLEGYAPWPTREQRIRTIDGSFDIGLIPSPSTSSPKISNNQLLTAYWALTLVAGKYNVELPEVEDDL